MAAIEATIKNQPAQFLKVIVRVLRIESLKRCQLTRQRARTTGDMATTKKGARSRSQAPSHEPCTGRGEPALCRWPRRRSFSVMWPFGRNSICLDVGVRQVAAKRSLAGCPTRLYSGG
jgi:hypothetical protein